jgi:hypothetical protein
MRPTPRELLILFTAGAAGGLIGDAANVDAGITRYLDHSVPFVWRSPIWFPVLVGVATACVGVVRLQLGPVRPDSDLRVAIAAGASAVAIYAITSLVDNDEAAAVVLVTALGILTACAFADRQGLICGLIAMAAGPLVEIAIVQLDLSEYTSPNDGLYGVGPTLPGLYLAFGVAAARITEALVASRRG